MTCDQPDCTERVTHRYTWPGRPESPTCTTHLNMHKGIAHFAHLRMKVVELEPTPPAPHRQKPQPEYDPENPHQ